MHISTQQYAVLNQVKGRGLRSCSNQVAEISIEECFLLYENDMCFLERSPSAFADTTA